jgi:type III restriction enzyme
MAVSIENPIINSPYLEPARHWELDVHGQPTGGIVQGRRPSEMYRPIPRERKGSKAAVEQEGLFDFDGILETTSSNETIGAIRRLVSEWRRGGHPNVTPTTRRLLEYWTDQSR